MDNKIKISQWIINIVVVLLFGAYAFIFNSVINRLESVEAKVENINPILLEIQTKLSGIEVNVEWIKKSISK
jgi:hypothetical protein